LSRHPTRWLPPEQLDPWAALARLEAAFPERWAPLPDEPDDWLPGNDDTFAMLDSLSGDPGR
jgi:hypothetical protein